VAQRGVPTGVEEAAVDCGQALAAWSDSRAGKRKGKRVGFPRFKKKTGVVPSFRLRDKQPKGRPSAIRLGDNDRPRSVNLPGLGQIGVHDDTRRLRRMLAKGRRVAPCPPAPGARSG
jgi:putative transposase